METQKRIQLNVMENKESDIYLTLENASEGLYKDKGSKFIAYAHPITSELEVKTILNDIKKKHYDARHHCYAYIINEDNLEKYRITDDGEPSGTAGKPIYNQIMKAGLSNVFIVVVRYFGGILLGTGGLINAYRSAAQDAISNAIIIEKFYLTNFTITFPYENTSEVMNIIKLYDINILEQKYDNLSKLCLSVRKSFYKRSEDKFLKISDLQIL